MFTRESPVICVLLLIVICPTAFAYIGQGQFSIFQGQPDIDGLISTGEWGSATWIDMDTVAFNPADLSQARWAAMWSPATNLIYVAITGTDTDHIFSSDFVNWNVQDDVEIYIDPGNLDTSNYNYDGQRFAQHYFMGPDGTGGAWSIIASQSADSAMSGGYAVTVNGDVITYEFALTPYADLNLADPAGSLVRTLQPGHVIGLDMIMFTKHTDTPPDIGMLCENAQPSKYRDAGQFLDHTLVAVPDPSTFILLGLGALILRKRRYAGL